MKRAFVLFAFLSFSACSTSTAPKAAVEPTPDAGPEAETQPVGPGTHFATYVILGDSISDKGGEGPFFYDLLATDLKGKLGDVRVEKYSKSGAISKDLPGQVKKLPTELAGPVAVSVTIGGNDMQIAALAILGGSDGADREKFKANLTAAYDELLSDGRFGEGVKVTVFHSSIYDPTDGEGNFQEAKCPGYLSAIPKTPTAAFWDNWNKDSDDAIAKYGASVVRVGLREKFQGHGVGKPDTWFYPDCIHPNKAGHQALSELFFSTMEP